MGGGGPFLTTPHHTTPPGPPPTHPQNVRQLFNCDSLQGCPLEVNSDSPVSPGSHWQERTLYVSVCVLGEHARYTVCVLGEQARYTVCVLGE